VKGGGVGKKKSATPKSKTPKEMKNPKTHFTAKINQLNKAIAKATDNEIDAIDRINRSIDNFKPKRREMMSWRRGF
jgi:hypothetical protein